MPSAQMSPANGCIVVIRPHSGLSGDIMVAGLAKLAGLTQENLIAILKDLGLGDLTSGQVALIERSHSGISGYGLKVELPEEHRHRHLSDTTDFFQAAAISTRARELGMATFKLLAETEGQIHGLSPDEVHFHEVGALDSLLDIGLASVLFDRLNPARLVCGPLPVCDGVIKCAHGLLPSPAPAVSKLLEGTMVRGLDSEGETVTPTGLALLKTFGAEFGAWPEMRLEHQALVYGSRILPRVPNGVLFASGLMETHEHQSLNGKDD